MIYSEKINAKINIAKMGEGIVNTIGIVCSRYNEMNFELKTIDEYGFVLNNDGMRSTVIHQYDRCRVKGGKRFVSVIDDTLLPFLSSECQWSRGVL